MTDASDRLIVSPDTDPNVIRSTRRYGLLSMPGVLSPTEVLAALDVGAKAIKWFSAELISPQVVKAIFAATLPSTLISPVGSIMPKHTTYYLAAGAADLGIGPALYSAETSASDVYRVAHHFVETLSAL